MKHILVVEDEPDIQEFLSAYLRREGYLVAIAGDGIDALERFRTNLFDLVLLDLMLPGMDGFQVCEAIRRESAIPIIMLTALDGEAEQLRGFDLQIDDYVTKPFSISILLRKIAAVLRRSGGAPQAVLSCGDIRLSLDARVCQVGQADVELTQREFDLLAELLKTPGRVLSREMLLDRVWGYDFAGDARIVDSHIKNLRKKLNSGCIETVRGVGYRAAKSR